MRSSMIIVNAVLWIPKSEPDPVFNPDKNPDQSFIFYFNLLRIQTEKSDLLAS